MLETIRNRKVLLAYVPLAIYWLILFTLTTLPGSKMPKTAFNDKVEHFSGYSLLAILLCTALEVQEKYPLLKKSKYLSTLLIVSVYGAFDEIHQYFIPGRSMDIRDWMADTLGAVIGIALFFVLILADKYFKERGTNLG